MKKLPIDDVENVPHFMDIKSHRKPGSRAIDAMDFAVVYFELEPDESFSGDLHTHHEQAELFYVMEGRPPSRSRTGRGTTLRHTRSARTRSSTSRRLAPTRPAATGVTSGWSRSQSGS